MDDTPRSIAAIGLGSNQGDKAGLIRTAVDRLIALPMTNLKALSRFYKTAPVGVTGQDWYVNAVALIETALPPNDLLAGLLSIERAMGRVRKLKWEPRPIDLDLLFYDRLILDGQDLILPHPLMHMRRFVLYPLLDVAPDWRHPVLNQSVKVMINGSDFNGQEVELL
ncbi:MAG: 2-amino-4-hydroxy-6-hydroxymethyldihydropteridine diphosphokinase [Deltaproteobacteria bacterium]|nr:2-amino-4-hydroxy-6-hydroxymethyldihydropteridine diphosphokinase [Deltaproteobacteria bacterium]